MPFDLKALLHPDPENAWRKAGRVEKAPRDPLVPAKAKLVKGIKDTLEIVKEGVENPKRGWYAIKGDVARVTVRVGNKLLPLHGQTRNVVAKHKASDFYNMVLKMVQTGELDENLRQTLTGDTKSSQDRLTKRADVGKPRAPWSPERHAREEAKRAERKKLSLKLS